LEQNLRLGCKHWRSNGIGRGYGGVGAQFLQFVQLKLRIFRLI